jgi:hypothetical protein
MSAAKKSGKPDAAAVAFSVMDKLKKVRRPNARPALARAAPAGAAAAAAAAAGRRRRCR